MAFSLGIFPLNPSQPVGYAIVSDVKAPIQGVKEGSYGGPGGVFLIWSAAKSGYKTATDTFIFDADGKILVQNVVVHYEEPNNQTKILEQDSDFPVNMTLLSV